MVLGMVVALGVVPVVLVASGVVLVVLVAFGIVLVVVVALVVVVTFQNGSTSHAILVLGGVVKLGGKAPPMSCWSFDFSQPTDKIILNSGS